MPTQNAENQELPAAALEFAGTNPPYNVLSFKIDIHAPLNQSKPVRATPLRDGARRQPTIIALDADGVLLDYHRSYALAWERTFGTQPRIKDATAYCPIDRYDVHRLEGAEKESFRDAFDHEFWAAIPLVNGSLTRATP